jgi:dynein intermediate chain 1
MYVLLGWWSYLLFASIADWTVKLWDETFPTAIMTFDLGTSVGDVAWAPYSSTVFAAVTDEGKVNVYDLHANKHEQLCEQKIVKKNKCTHVTFSGRAPILLVGDSGGGVTSLKLSPNLRKITPITAAPSRKVRP